MTSHLLGAHADAQGVSFRVFARHARQLWLCLLDVSANAEITETLRIPMQQSPEWIWTVYVKGCKPGQRYGFRAAGEFAPQDGHFYNPAKLLLDPYARKIVGYYAWHGSTLSHNPEHPAFDEDSATHVPLGVVTSPLSPPTEKRPSIAWEDTVIYEVHVKGLTCLHPDIPVSQRGRYQGLCHPVMLEHYRKLGITTLQLLPIHFFIDELHLYEHRRVNYWGYNPLGWFAPTPRYALEDALGECRQMVESLHSVGIEVILDVVFNHSAEGDQRGPTLSLRGLDNAVYYRREEGDPFVFSNESGCGNSLDTDQPAVLRLVLDCLRFWSAEVGVDGFRFDLASALGRRAGYFDSGHALWAAILQDPALCELKWIVEPWDLGISGYQLGNYPEGFSEWNDQFRNDVRRFVRGDEGLLGNVAKRIAGSWDIFRKAGTGARASINYITAHDGFTLRDLVCYSRKHNQDNGEQNNDGSDDNFSANYGVEGLTDEFAIQQLRARQQRNFIALLALSQGVPMLTQGDENGRTQAGNNNAYCQDNSLGWCAWPAPDAALQAFATEVFRLRRQWQIGRIYKPCQPLWKQINTHFHFYRPDGQEMAYADWQQTFARSLCILMKTPSTRVLLLINAYHDQLKFMLPPLLPNHKWVLQMDTFTDSSPLFTHAGVCYLVHGRSVVLLAESTLA